MSDRDSITVGLTFGLTSGVITTLGLLVGLTAGTDSRPAVIGGILTIAVADSLSDALGVHVSEEASGARSGREVWLATGVTFAAKLTMALTFLVPVIALDLGLAVTAAIIWGAVALAGLSYAVARAGNRKPTLVIVEHLAVAAVVVAAAEVVGRTVARVVT